ncbi:hypothetical protein M9458_038066, partial [Cirrhinus mrigala]
PAHTMPACPESVPVMAALPQPAHKMAAIPEPVHKMAAIPEPVHKMAAIPEPVHKSLINSSTRIISSKSDLAMSAAPKANQVMADLSVS